jgi:membrane-associated phospholipid phosphatase
MATESAGCGAPSWLFSRKLSLACLMLATTLGVCANMKDNPLQPLDDAIHDIFYLHGSSDFAWFSRWVLSSPGHIQTGVAGGLIGIILLLKLGQRSSVVSFILPLLLTGVVSVSLKELVGRLRPDTSVGLENFAWPSGHSMLATVFWGLVCFFIIRIYADNNTGSGMLNRLAETKNATRMWISFIVFTGCGRLLGGVHWFTDVIGGIAIGILILQTALMMEQHLGIDADSSDSDSGNYQP